MLFDKLLDVNTTLWWIAALLALGIEFFSGTLYLLVVAVALAGGGLAALFTAQHGLQFLIASVVGMLSLVWVTRWKRRQAPRTDSQADDPDLGQTVSILSVSNADPALAKVAYRGSQWDALLVPPGLKTGQLGVITGKKGNQLQVAAHQNQE